MSEFQIVQGYFGPHIKGKLGAQRKAQEYSVSPRSDGLYMVQSSKAIGVFDPATGKGVLNIKGCYFAHLSATMGAKPYEFPKDFVTLAQEVCLTPGGETSRGGVTLVHTVTVI